MKIQFIFAAACWLLAQVFRKRWPPMTISEDIDAFYDFVRQTFYISLPYQRNDAMNPGRTLNTSNNILGRRSY